MKNSNLEQRARIVLNKLEELSRVAEVAEKERDELTASLIEFSNLRNVSGAESCIDIFDSFIFLQDLLASVQFQDQVFDWLIPICQSCDLSGQSRLTISLFTPFLEPPLSFDDPGKSVAYYRILKCLEHLETCWVAVAAFSDHFFCEQTLVSALNKFVDAGNLFADRNNLARIQYDEWTVLKEVNRWT